MVISKQVEKYEKKALKLLGLRYKGLKWCELGDQLYYKNKIAKEIYTSRGVEHISIDINGENGALPIDLDKPVPFIFLNQFDVITNYGTIEHVNNQYQVFKNVHDMCKKGGIMIHVFPKKGHWLGHCRYYYTESFVKNLANICNYKIVDYTLLNKGEYKTPNNMIAVTYLKKDNNKFISKKEFNQIKGLYDSGNIEFVGNYSKTNYVKIISIITKILPVSVRRRVPSFMKIKVVKLIRKLTRGT